MSNLSKVIVNGHTKIDLTGVTADKNSIQKGYYAVDKHGQLIEGQCYTDDEIATYSFPTELHFTCSSINGCFYVDNQNQMNVTKISGDSVLRIEDGTASTGAQVGVFGNWQKLQEIDMPNLVYIGSRAFQSSTVSLTSVSFPNLIGMGDSAFYQYGGTSALKSIYLPKLISLNSRSLSNLGIEILVLPSIVNFYGMSVCNGCKSLTTIDLGENITGIGNSIFGACSVLNTIILRKSSVVPLTWGSAFSSTPFDTGGSGGTIYIPKSLYDLLGTGQTGDYKAATNWSTFDGYGTITWAQIEGSQYETKYADGTDVPSSGGA